MRRITIVACLAFLAGVATIVASSEPGSAQSTSTPAPAGKPDAFGEQVRSYLLANPEVIVEALQLYQQRQQAQQAEAAKGMIAARADEILRDPAAPTGGNPAGDVTLVEFFDYNCKYCRTVAPTIAEVLAADAGLRLVYKEFPILGDGSDAAAQVALAAARQGLDRYEALHHDLMRVSGSVTEAGALQVAAANGLDLDRLRRDLVDPALAATLARNRALAAELGINGTPGFVIGEEIVPGAVDRATLEGLIAKARASKEAAP